MRPWEDGWGLWRCCSGHMQRRADSLGFDRCQMCMRHSQDATAWQPPTRRTFRTLALGRMCPYRYAQSPASAVPRFAIGKPAVKILLQRCSSWTIAYRLEIMLWHKHSLAWLTVPISVWLPIVIMQSACATTQEHSIAAFTVRVFVVFMVCMFLLTIEELVAMLAILMIRAFAPMTLKCGVGCKVHVTVVADVMVRRIVLVLA